MRADKFTQKMQEAQDVASQFSQQEITNERPVFSCCQRAATPE